jgi:hypothetical protein
MLSAQQPGTILKAASLLGGFPISATDLIAHPSGVKFHFWAVDQIQSVIIVREDDKKFTGIKMRPGTIQAAVREYRRQLNREVH